MHRYRDWLRAPATIASTQLSVATKPGVSAHGSLDQAAFMLAEAVMQRPAPARAKPAVDNFVSSHKAENGSPMAAHINPGNGLVAAAAVSVGYRVLACDRLLPNTRATARSIELNSSEAPTGPTGDNSETHQPERSRHQSRHAALPGSHADTDSATLVTVRLPTDKLSMALAVLEAHRILKTGGECLLAGANNEGAKSAERFMQWVFGNTRLEAQHSAHRLIRSVKTGSEIPTSTSEPVEAARRADKASLALLNSALPWQDLNRFHHVSFNVAVGTHKELSLTQATRPGVFSWEHADHATRLLLEAMDVRAGDRVLDLGCGAGVLGLAAATITDAPVVLLDADAESLHCARETLRLAGHGSTPGHVTVHASDVTDAVDGMQFDLVLSNPPFHLGKSVDMELPAAFIHEAWEVLTPGGRLMLVANRRLPYEALIREKFGHVQSVREAAGFKVLLGVRR